jgi:hypothetical protein
MKNQIHQETEHLYSGIDYVTPDECLGDGGKKSLPSDKPTS